MEFFQPGKLMGKELASLFVGKLIGEGVSRKVYKCSFDQTLVVKVEEGSRSFNNQMEWRFWNDFKDTPEIAKWLAPCVDISTCGAILLQKRVDPISFEQAKLKWPQLPRFLNDRKPDNFGLLGEQLVCCDYAGLTPSFNYKLEKAGWWQL